MTSLIQTLSALLGEAFEAQGLSPDFGIVRVSDRPELCQFQCNGAMPAAKQAGKPPRDIAQAIADQLKNEAIFETIEIAGPGFINLHITDAALAAHITATAGDQNFGIETPGKGQTVVLDYGGMNVAKAMHVGHLRSLAIGDCLKRMLRFAGYEALGDIHMGDWGLQMGQIISAFEIRNPEWPYFDTDFSGDYPAEPPFSYEELEEIYPAAAQACKDDPARLDAARKATMALQDGHRGYRALWQHFMTLSIKDIKANIALLDVDFEIWKGEADVNDIIPALAKDLADQNITEQSDGATIIRVERESDKKEMPPLIFLKSDGAATYGTTDVATLYDRVKTYPNLAAIIYETDLRQNLHFEQVFRAAEKAGYADGMTLKHIGHGTVNGPDGKPFKTREGKAMKFADMVHIITEKAAERLNEANLAQDMTADERADIARKIAISVLKFTELSNQAHMDYNFDIERMTSFEGKTGPYLLYQAVRIQSLLKKAGAENPLTTAETSYDFVLDEKDRTLALLLTELPDHFATALKHYTPHILCDYAFKLAQEFSSFYGNCHILSEDNKNLRNSRLALCTLTHRQLIFMLNILGIIAPERM